MSESTSWPRPGELDALRSAFRTLGEAYVKQARQLIKAMKPLLDWAETPEGKIYLAAAKAAQSAQGCHCLCGVRHPGRAMCEGYVAEARVITIRYGATDVPMCPACAAAGAA